MIVFTALAAAGWIMAVGTQVIIDSSQQVIMIALGSALFGAALSFLLIRLFSLIEK